MQKIIFYLPLILISIAIFIISNMSQVSFPPIHIFGKDKLLHFIAYFVYAVFALLAMIAYNKELAYKAIIMAFFMSVLFGLSDEIHQYFVPGRCADIFDLLADTLGISFAMLFRKQVYQIYLKINNIINQ